MSTTTAKSLEQLCIRLEQIDDQTALKGREYVEDGWQIAMENRWLKGREVSLFYELDGNWLLEERKDGRPGSADPPPRGIRTYRSIATDIGVSDKTIKKWVSLYLQRPEENGFRKWLDSAAKVIGQRWIAGLVGKPMIEAPKAKPGSEGKYRVVYADPPWLYESMQHTDTAQATTLDEQYPQMDTDAICAIPVSTWIQKDSVLFLWVTSPKLFEAKAVIDSWGFTYKASIVWDKVKHNVGYYVSVRHELLLICTRGSCLPDVKKLEDSVVSIERGEHSVKPPYFREWIDRMYVPREGMVDRVEMFARGDIPEHWDRWGVEQ